MTITRRRLYDQLQEPIKRHLFRALVELQDETLRKSMTVSQTLRHLEDRYALEPGTMKRVEAEGLTKNWLDEEFA
jgi:hypothetical protein